MTTTQPAAGPRRRPQGKPDACSSQWDNVTAPAWGSAAVALFWVALEQPGPWGSHAFQSSRLDPTFGRALHHQCAINGGRALLIRSVEAHRGSATDAPRRVFIAGGMPHWKPWLLTAELDDVASLLTLPWQLLAYGDQRAVMDALPALRPHPDPALLVCTNAKRDVCCAVRGRPLAADASAAMPGQVWECTHTGGHRFAPTAVVLPHGQTVARLTVGMAVDALQAAARDQLAPSTLDPWHNRGLPHVIPQVQAAEAWVRHQTGETAVGHIRARATRPLVKGQSGVVEVEHRDGRHWLLHVRQQEDAYDLRRNSCSTAAVPVNTWAVDPVSPDAPVLGAWPAWPEPETDPLTPADVPDDLLGEAPLEVRRDSPRREPLDWHTWTDAQTMRWSAPHGHDEVLAALLAREPLLHRREVVATPAELDRELAADFWQWGASGTRYDREAVTSILRRRLASAGPDPFVTESWRLEDPRLRQLGPDLYLLTYTLHRQGGPQGAPAVTRRSSVWRGSVGQGWQVLFHQGTVVATPVPGRSPLS